MAIPGVGSNRVNAALYYGGPQLLGQTVGNLVGIQPDYVFVTRFPYFENMVNDIGGITVDNPRPFSDVYLKHEGFEAGMIHLNGYDAMAFSRIRKTLPRGRLRPVRQPAAARWSGSTARSGPAPTSRASWSAACCR